MPPVLGQKTEDACGLRSAVCGLPSGSPIDGRELQQAAVEESPAQRRRRKSLKLFNSGRSKQQAALAPEISDVLYQIPSQPRHRKSPAQEKNNKANTRDNTQATARQTVMSSSQPLVTPRANNRLSSQSIARRVASAFRCGPPPAGRCGRAIEAGTEGGDGGYEWEEREKLRGCPTTRACNTQARAKWGHRPAAKRSPRPAPKSPLQMLGREGRPRPRLAWAGSETCN